MAQPTNTFDSYDSVGTREDLQDKIYMVSPEKTPIVSAIRRFTATQRLHEWQRDSLAAPNADNAVIEGDIRTGSAMTPTQRVANTVQLFDTVAVVSSTQAKTKSAGRSSEMKYQISKAPDQRSIRARLLNMAPELDAKKRKKEATLNKMYDYMSDDERWSSVDDATQKQRYQDFRRVLHEYEQVCDCLAGIEALR